MVINNTEVVHHRAKKMKHSIFYIIVAIFAMAKLSHAVQPSNCSEDFGATFTTIPIGPLSFCPGITIEINTDSPGVLQPNLGLGYNYAFWVKDMRSETLQCFPKKGYKFAEEVSDDGVVTITASGNFAKIFFAPNEETGVNFFNYTYVFSGPNPNNISAPGLYYMDGGSYSFVKTPDEDGSGISTIDYTRIVGNFIDLCAKFNSLINGGGDILCATLIDKRDCKDNDSCMWAGGNGCISMPWN